MSLIFKGLLRVKTDVPKGFPITQMHPNSDRAKEHWTQKCQVLLCMGASGPLITSGLSITHTCPQTRTGERWAQKSSVLAHGRERRADYTNAFNVGICPVLQRIALLYLAQVSYTSEGTPEKDSVEKSTTVY